MGKALGFHTRVSLSRLSSSSDDQDTMRESSGSFVIRELFTSRLAGMADNLRKEHENCLEYKNSWLRLKAATTTSTEDEGGLSLAES